MQEKTYKGEMTDENISHIFRDAADFIRRELRCEEFTVYAYAIDGLIASAYASDYIFKPITQHLHADSMEGLYDRARKGMIYNNVAVACEDLNQMAFLLVNGFCVVLFPGAGAIGFEVKTPDKRGTSALSRVPRMHLWRRSVPIPAMCVATCARRICGFMKRR